MRPHTRGPILLTAGLACLALCSCSTTNVKADSGSPVAGRPSGGVQQTTAVVVPAGTTLQVRLNESVGTAISRPGQHFDAVLETPLAVNGIVVVPRGVTAGGIVREAAPSGRLKGRAVLVLALDTIEVGGRRTPIQTSSQTRTSDRHRRNNLLFLGGGSGTGAVIGALAGGGAGAAIGAGSGAAAGLAGAFITGKKQVRVPAESLLTFRLAQPLKLNLSRS